MKMKHKYIRLYKFPNKYCLNQIYKNVLKLCDRYISFNKAYSFMHFSFNII